MRRDDKILRALLWGATAVSFGSTAFGLFAWFHAETSFAEALAFAAFWSLFLQAGIVAFWSYAGRAESRVAMIAAIVLGLSCSLGSMTFASAVWLMRTNRSGLEHTQTRTNADTLIEPLARMNQRITGVSASMTDVAAAAATKAEIETNVGGTCEGSKPVRDCGPICRLRKRQKTEASNLASELGNVAQASTDIISSIQGDLSRDGMKRGYTQAAGLARHPALANAKAWLDAQVRGFDTKFVDAQTGAALVCRDPAFRDQLVAARKALDVDLSLSGLPPEPARVGYSDAAAKSINDTLAIVRMAATGSFNKSAMLTLQDSMIGIGIAAFIEIILVFLVLVDAADLKRRGAFETAAERFIFTRRRMPREQLERLAVLGHLVDRFTYRSNTMADAFFVRPLDGRPETVAQCSDIVRLFDLPFAKHQVKIIPREVVADWASGNDDLTGGAGMFEVRLMTKQLDRQLRLIARDAFLLPKQVPGNDNGEPASAGRALVARA
jgi:hypothetical protein